jgi:hypothetical protein
MLLFPSRSMFSLVIGSLSHFHQYFQNLTLKLYFKFYRFFFCFVFSYLSLDAFNKRLFLSFCDIICSFTRVVLHMLLLGIGNSSHLAIVRLGIPQIY